jgi:hypothetical protein
VRKREKPDEAPRLPLALITPPGDLAIRLYRIHEICAMWKVNEKTLRRWVEKAEAAGRKVRYTERWIGPHRREKVYRGDSLYEVLCHRYGWD